MRVRDQTDQQTDRQMDAWLLGNQKFFKEKNKTQKEAHACCVSVISLKFTNEALHRGSASLKPISSQMGDIHIQRFLY